jgi:RNA polymerase sigma factor (sigma-70 family)
MSCGRTEAERQLERLFHLGTMAGLTDAQLLEQFVAGDRRSATAFEAVVERHGPMVLRVCRKTLGDPHAAEDAFQATFLVLARRAATLSERELLGNWLYGVAMRTARKARRAAAHRVVRDRAAAYRWPMAVAEPSADESRDEMGRVLHEEIARLPSSYRTAVVVCYLEGQTQAQAARELQLAESTVRGRLARARKLLGQRLTRRGIVLSTGLLALETAKDAVAAPLTRAAMESVARAALLFVRSSSAAHGSVSVTACGIAQGVLSTMWFTSLKVMAVMFLAITLAVIGSAALLQRTAEAQPQPGGSGPKVAAGIAAPAQEFALSLPLSAGPAPALASSPLQDPSTGRSRPRQRRGQDAAPIGDVDPELAKRVPGPIVRAIPVSKDCMILAYLPNQNLGHVDNFGLANNGGGVRALLDWPMLPPDEAAAPDRRFLIAVYSRNTTSNPPAGPIHAFELLDSWREMTWWSQQPRYDPEPVATYKFEPGEGWKLFDVTPLVQVQAKTGRNKNGVLLRFLSEDSSGSSFSGYDLVSREGTGKWANRHPLLLVVKAARLDAAQPK